MKNYSIYYSYKTIGDVIIIIFDNEKTNTKVEIKDNVAIIYHDDEVIGYNIFNVKEIMKIKSQGLIYLPSPTLITVINNILKNANCETLEFIKSSGYITGEVADVIELDETKSFITVNLVDSVVNTIVKGKHLNISDRVVIALTGTRLNSGQIVRQGNMDGTLLDGHICTNKDLGILNNPDDILLLDKEDEIGKDFFMTEEI